MIVWNHEVKFFSSLGEENIFTDVSSKLGLGWSDNLQQNMNIISVRHIFHAEL